MTSYMKFMTAYGITFTTSLSLAIVSSIILLDPSMVIPPIIEPFIRVVFGSTIITMVGSIVMMALYDIATNKGEKV